MKTTLISLLSGLLFGAGLVLSGMTDPAKVQDFLALGAGWNPSLAFVMVGAIGVHWIAYRLVPSMKSPLLGGRWQIPTRRDVDRRLLLGAALFGAGWGLGGYCPGPALTSAVSGAAPTLIFTGSMLAGMWLWSRYEAMQAAAPAPAPAQNAPTAGSAAR